MLAGDSPAVVVIDHSAGPSVVEVDNGNQPSIVEINQGPLGDFGPITTFTETALNGYIYGDGSHIAGATEGSESATGSTLAIRDASGNLTANAYILPDGANTATIDNGILTASQTYTLPDASGYVSLTKNANGANDDTEIYVKAAEPIAAGQAVFISGATGANKIISLAQANTDALSSKTIGLSAQSLANNEFGYVVTEGDLSGLSINLGSGHGVNEGDPIWLSPTTPGGLIFGVANKPSAPNHLVFLGIVTRINGNTLTDVFVKVQNGFELEELHNVAINNPVTGQVLTYNSTTGLWSNTSPTSAPITTATGTNLTGFIYGDGTNIGGAVEAIYAGENYDEYYGRLARYGNDDAFLWTPNTIAFGLGPQYTEDDQFSTLTGQYVGHSWNMPNASGTIALTANADGSIDGLWSESGTTLYYSGGNVGINTSTPTANLEVDGTVIIQDDAVLNGTENTMPNQTLDGGINSVVTHDILLRNELNYGWKQLVFYSNNESPSTATLSRTDYNIAGLFNITSGALTGYAHYFLWYHAGFYYPNGSGRSLWFNQPFTMLFEYDVNNSSQDFNTWLIIGLNSYTSYSEPNATEKGLAFVHRTNGASDDTLEVMILDGSGTATTSGEIPATYFHDLSSKQRFCVVWDGATFSLYVSSWSASLSSNNTQPPFSLVASVTNNNLSSTSMDGFQGGFLQICKSNIGSSITTYLDCPKFIRRAVHPI